MKSITTLLVVAGLIISVQSCYVSKPLDHDVHISIDSAFPIVITNTGNSNFSGKHTEAEYRSAYMDQLIKELAVNRVIADNVSPEFTVKITSLEIHESTKMDTVKDVKSRDNGMARELTLADLKTSGMITRISSGKSGNWDAEKDKDEKLTNNQSLDQMIAGQNKDNTLYREKNFDENEFVHLATLCGRRAAVRIEKELQKLLK